jgi:hypothetical protein
MQAQQILKNQIASGVFSSPSSSVSSSLSSIPSALSQEQTSASQLALLQSFTSEMTIPTMHHQQMPQQQQQQQHFQQKVPQSPTANNQVPIQQIKTEINNNGDESNNHVEATNDK